MRAILASFLVSIFFWGTSYAETTAIDYSARGILRSYPTGASVTGTIGHSVKIWGGNSKLFYGFIRPSVSVQTSGIVNYGRAQLDIYPISFIGLYAGYNIGSRNVDELADFDCSQVICDETLKRPYYGLRAALKFGNFFFSGETKFEDIEVDGRAGIFAEESGALLGRSGSDFLTTNIAVLGYELSKDWAVGGFYSRWSMKYLENNSNMTLGFIRHKRGDWTYMLGMGNFHSRADQNNFSILGVIDWVGERGFLLF